MKAFGLARIGKDVEIRMTPGGDAVANISLAFSWGKKGADNNRPTEWVDASLWGKTAEALAPYLKKGGLVVATLEDLHIEKYQGKNGEGHKLVARVINLEFAGGNQRSDHPVSNQDSTTRQATPKTALDFSDMDSDIPF